MSEPLTPKELTDIKAQLDLGRRISADLSLRLLARGDLKLDTHEAKASPARFQFKERDAAPVEPAEPPPPLDFKPDFDDLPADTSPESPSAKGQHKAKKH
jgi:hypothetical protein